MASLSIDRVSIIIKQSINSIYLSILNATTTIHKALQDLHDYLQLASNKAKEILKVKYKELYKSPAKAKVEQWTLEWESAFREAEHLKILVLNKETMSHDFLIAAKKFILELSMNQMISKHASKQKLEFYETIREF